MPPKVFADLDVDGSGESGSSSDEEEGSQRANARKAPANLADPAPEELAALGFDGAAPLVGTVPEPEPAANWAWGTAAARDASGGAATAAAPPEDRKATLAAASAIDAVALEAARARAEALSRRDGADGKKALNFKQREKRKRDAGMQGGGHKSVVEEEKRVAREMGAM